MQTLVLLQYQAPVALDKIYFCGTLIVLDRDGPFHSPVTVAIALSVSLFTLLIRTSRIRSGLGTLVLRRLCGLLLIVTLPIQRGRG